MDEDHVHAVGSEVWVLTAEDTWLKAIVKQLHDESGEVTVTREDGVEAKLPREKCPLQNMGRPVEVKPGLYGRTGSCCLYPISGCALYEA